VVWQGSAGNRRPYADQVGFALLVTAAGCFRGGPSHSRAADMYHQSMDLTRYFVTLSAGEVNANGRNWTGDEIKGKSTHHGVVRIDESPLDLTLHWRQRPESSPRLIGRHRLDLRHLLRDG
jgi:hypothetical protein